MVKAKGKNWILTFGKKKHGKAKGKSLILTFEKITWLGKG